MLLTKKNKDKQNRFISILKRTPVIVCLSICALLYMLSFFIERSFKNYSVTQNINEINSVIDSIERELSYLDPKSEKGDLIQNILLILASHHHLFAYIVDNNDNILYKTRGPNLLLALKNKNLENITDNRTSFIWNYNNSYYRLSASQLSIDENQTFTMVVAISRDLQIEFLNRLHYGLLILILISCVLILIGTQLAIYITQEPINKLIKRIESVNTRSLNYRIPTTSVPAKYISLVEAFNNMISRMEIVFQRQSNFTADIAHEMRTPITNLTTQTQIALNNARTSQEYKEILYSNLEEFERLSQIITDMLFLAQADNKQLIPQLNKIDLIDMFNHMFDYYEFLSEEKGIQLKLEGNCASILGDKLMIGRAISNLLSNAIRYTPAGGTIIASLSQPDNKSIKIVIANTGKKIEEKHLPHLFERFYRADESRQRKGEGAGIGLAIVKSIIEAHKGRISVESDNISTRFIMIFPLQ